MEYNYDPASGRYALHSQKKYIDNAKKKSIHRNTTKFTLNYNCLIFYFFANVNPEYDIEINEKINIFYGLFAFRMLFDKS